MSRIPSQKPSWAYLGLAFLCVALGVVLGRFVFAPSTSSSKDASADSVEQGVANISHAKEASMAVEVISPQTETITHRLSASGVIAAKQVAEVGARVSGVAITEVRVEVGDYVKAGQVLARLDRKTASQQTEVVQAELEQAEAALTKARADVARVTPLIEIDAISREQYDAYLTAERQAIAQVKALKARLASTQTNESHTQVVAPVSGIVSAKTAEIGMMATGAPLFSIIKNGELEWQASIPTNEANKIAIGQSATVKVGNEVVSAIVERIAPIANNSREVTVHASLSPSSMLRAGMYQTGEFLLASAQAEVLPYRVVSSSDGMDYVWTVHKTDGSLYRAERTKVEVLGHHGDKVRVSLPKETLVVAEGGNFLSQGSLVKVVASPKAMASEAHTAQSAQGE